MACRWTRWCELISINICASVVPDCRSASNNCIPPYSIIRLGLGAYLYSSSALLPLCSLPCNSHTFPKTLVMGSHPARPRRVRFSDANTVPPHDGPVFSLTYYPAACGRKGHGSGLPLPSSIAADFLSGQQLYSTMHWQHIPSWVGAYLHSFSVLLPPSSLSRNSRTFPKMLVTGSHPARPRRVRFSDANPVPPYDGPCKDVRNISEYFGLFSYIYDVTAGYVIRRYVFPLSML